MAAASEKSHLRIANIEEEMPEEENPHAVKMKTTLANAAVSAFLKANVAYERKWLLNILSPEGRKFVEFVGEHDYDAEPNRQALNAFHVYLELCQAGQVELKTDREITHAMGVESERLRHFIHLAGIEVG